MNRVLYPLIFLSFILLYSPVLKAQLIAPDLFMQGDYVEVGVGAGGWYGTRAAAPAGYHGRTPGPRLGFVADPDKDGWTVGIPNYCGDYFVPGVEQEGWDIQVGNKWAKAWLDIAALTGGLTGSNVSLTETGDRKIAVWEGAFEGLAIRQTTILRKEKVYFIIKVTLKNTTSSDIKDIYYDRTLDPDNTSTMGPTGTIPGIITSRGATTANEIVYKLPNPKARSLVSAIGMLTVVKPGAPDTVDYNVYLGIGTKDCRAKPYILNGVLFPAVNDSPSRLHREDPTLSPTYLFDLQDKDTSDAATGLVFHIPVIKPGDSTSFFMAYVLSTADLDSAFADMAPVWMYEGKQYESGDTIKICRSKTAADEIKALNIGGGDEYSWTWDARPGMKNTTGTLNEITLTNTPTTYVVRPSEAVSCLDSMIITVMPYIIPDPPAVTSPLTYCRLNSALPLEGKPMAGATMRYYTTASGGTPATKLIPATNAVGTFTYYASQINGICESERTPITVTVNPLPKLELMDFTSPSYCGGKDGRIRMKVDGIGETFKLVYDKDGEPQPELTLTANASGILVIPDLGNGAYTAITVINQYGCKSNTVFGPVNLNFPAPPGPAVNNNGPLCVNAAAALTATLVPGATYSWSGPDGFSSTDRNPTFTTTENSGGTYTLRVQVGECVYTPSTTNLIITPTPKHQQFKDIYVLCQNTDLVVNILREPGISYLWSGNGINQVDQSLKISNVQFSDVGRYYLTASTDNGCTTTDSLVLQVDKRPSFAIVSDTAVCAVDSAALFVNSDAPSIKWSPATGLGRPESFVTKAKPEQTTTYTATVASGNACPDTSGKVKVGVIPTPVVRGYDTTVRMNIPYTVLPVFSEDVVKWIWQPTDSLSCGDCPAPVFNSSRDMTYVVKGVNKEGCV
ncbi:MAG TPA: hypothetical protein VL092_06535, partial [Chitinophagaceae bacterium]|nr:hypothetical protein [Chitinophagaceae bacterium]